MDIQKEEKRINDNLDRLPIKDHFTIICRKCQGDGSLGNVILESDMAMRGEYNGKATRRTSVDGVLVIRCDECNTKLTLDRFDILK